MFQGKSVSEQNDLKCIAFEKKTFAGLIFMVVLYEKTCIVSREKGGESTRINEITKVEDEEEEARIASLCRRCCARPQQMGA